MQEAFKLGKGKSINIFSYFWQMICQPKGVHFLLLLLLFFSSEIFSQKEDTLTVELPYYKKQIELHHDNDFLLFTDWYYTTGSFINYRVLLNEQDGTRDKRQLNFVVSQEFYTPSNVLSERVEDFDRPFAGYSAFTNQISFINEKRILDLSFQIGVSGAISGAEGFQSWFHSTNESNNPTWVGQIDDAVHANLYANYTREWNLLPNPFSVYVAWKPGLALGTKDIFIQNEALFYFGTRKSLMHTMAHHQLGVIEEEFFFVVKFTYRYVMYDSLLEGNLIGDNSVFVLNPINNLFTYGIDGFYRKKRMEYKLGYNYSSRKAPTTKLHTWILISIARNF